MSATNLQLSHKEPTQHSYLPEVQDVATVSSYQEVNGHLYPTDVVRYRFGSCPNFDGRHFRNVLLIDTWHNGQCSFSVSYFKALNDCLYYMFERMREHCTANRSAEILPASNFWTQLISMQHIIKFHLIDQNHQRVKVHS